MEGDIEERKRMGDREEGAKKGERKDEGGGGL